MFSSISGPGHSAPLQRPTPKPRRQEVAIQPQPASQSARPASLIHPGTAAEFRHDLEGILGRLPLSLLHAFVEQGYCLHVIDSTGLHPLTLEVSDFDPAQICGDEPEVVLSPVDDGGASTREELDEWLHYVQVLNPDLDLGGSAQDQIYLPAYRYWFGRRLPLDTVAFLRDPRVLLEAPTKEGSVAGMVTHGLLPGLKVEANRILFWDFPFRQRDPLLDWYVLHELGHTTDYSLAFRYPDLWRDWLARLEQAFAQERPWLTDYAATSPHEYFAEGFAAWATPARSSSPSRPASALAAQRLTCHRQRLNQVDPWLEELIDEAVGALLS
ncbi:hypothetical protein IV102_19065 [bacterium]|nr:hypothetical protein [bacterium]